MGFGWFSRGADNGDKTLARAQKLSGQERWAEALTFFDEVLARDAASEEAGRGGRECREKLVAFNLEEADAYRQGDPAKAREHARLALDLAGAHPDLRERASMCLSSLGSGASATRPEVPAARQPLFAGSCSCAAPCATAGGVPTEAADIDVEDLAEFYLDACEPAARQAFEKLGAPFRSGFVHLQQGELGEARPHLERAARDHATEPGGPYALGLLASLEGKNREAESHFRRTLALDPAFAPALRHLAETLRERGNQAEAAELLAGWLERNGEEGEARLLLAVNLLETGRHDAAAEHAQRAGRALEDGDPRPALVLARALHLAGDPQAAIGTLQGVLNRRPDVLEALVELANLLLAQGGAGAERAAEAFKRCYRQDPERGWWYLIKVAEAYRARGWEPQAREVLARAREELPDEPEAEALWEAAARGPDA